MSDDTPIRITFAFEGVHSLSIDCLFGEAVKLQTVDKIKDGLKNRSVVEVWPDIFVNFSKLCYYRMEQR